MAGILSRFNTNVNYWDIVPQMKVIEPFKSLYTNDKSSGKKKSSKIMWAIAMLVETDNNKLALYPEDDRKNIIAEDFINDKNFKWNDYTKYIESYEKTVLTHAKRALLAQRKKTDERIAFLSSVPYTMENAREIDTLLANTDKFMIILKKLEDAVKAEDSVGNKKGGRAESLSEQGVI